MQLRFASESDCTNGVAVLNKADDAGVLDNLLEAYCLPADAFEGKTTFLEKLAVLGTSSTDCTTTTLECGEAYDVYILYSDYAADYINAIAPGHDFKPVRPCFIQPAKQLKHPSTHPQTPHARASHTSASFLIAAESHHSLFFETVIHFLALWAMS